MKSSIKRLSIISQDCTDCDLCKTRTNVVFGEGSTSAALMLVGEAPGFSEDQSGRPFVGRSGKKLTQWLEQIGLKREDVYITNVVKCRPPQNRDPNPKEIEACSRYLRQQIKEIRPKVICTVGRISTQMLLDTNKPMRDLRGKVWAYRDIVPLFPIYHPSFILRDPRRQKDVDIDLKFLRLFLDTNDLEKESKPINYEAL